MCGRSSGEPIGDLCTDDVDAVIVAVSDDAISEVLRQVNPGNALWIHTAGSVAIDAIPFERRGVIYPLQTMLKDKEPDWSNLPLFIEGEDPLIEELARTMSPNVKPLDSRQRCQLHASAVLSCNLVMHLWSEAERLLGENGLDFALLHPLMCQTLQRAMSGSPSEAMTGPARRGDVGTLRKHLEALPDDLKPTYELLSNQILKKYHPELSI